jgi:hypothetical protein
MPVITSGGSDSCHLMLRTGRKSAELLGRFNLDP